MQGCTSTSTSFKYNPGISGKNNTQEDLQAIYSSLEKTNGKVFELDPQLSSIRIYVFRGGTAPALGHNHVLSAPKFTGFVYLPNKGTANARFDLQFRLDQLEIDHPEARSKLGEVFESIPTLDAIKRTREHMLSEENLQANRFPMVYIHSVKFAGEAPKLAIEVLVEIHGQQQRLSIPINIELLPGHLSATGTFVIRQTDFGIHPYSVLGGFLAVQNELVIEFSLVDK
jgi:hypothetical protein